MNHEQSAAPAATFFDCNRAALAELGAVLALPTQFAADRDTAVSLSQPWVRGDHATPENRLHLNDEQAKQVLSLAEQMGLTAEQPLPAGHYDQILVLGGMHAGNMRRMEFLSRTLASGNVTTDRLMLLGGQRPLNSGLEAVDLKQDLNDIPPRDPTDPWLARLNSRNLEELWETDLLRVAAHRQLGNLTLKQLHLRLGQKDPLERYEFDWQGVPTTLLHTLAVERTIGQPRHTTEACITEWLRDYAPPQQDGQQLPIGFVVANPHIERTTKTASRVLRAAGRDDIQLISGGPAASTSLGPNFYLGEIARNLYEDQLAGA